MEIFVVCVVQNILVDKICKILKKYKGEMHVGDQKTKLIEICLVIGVMLILGACGVKKTGEPVVITYDELEVTQKKVIDGIYDNYGIWKSVYDSGKDFYCTNVTFFEENETVIFATFYKTRKDAEYNSIFGFYMFFEVDVESGKLSKHNYSLFGNNAQVKRGAAEARASNGQEFNTDMDEVAIKDTLATVYYNAIIK